MELVEGRLNPAMSLPEVLQFLSMGKMTGTLTVTQGSYSATLVIRQGKLISSTNLGRPRRLGQMLINRGLLPRSAVEDALAFQKQHAPQTPLGQILIQRGNVTTEQVRQALRLQLEEEMWELFGVQEGTFKFEHGDERAVAGDSLVELDIDPLLIEGTRRLDEWARIVRNIPQGEAAVPAVNPDHLDRDVMTFSDNEWRVLSLINGYYNIGSIASRSGIGKFETFRVINSFLASAHVVIDSDASVEGAGYSELAGVPSPNLGYGSGGTGEMDEEMDFSFHGNGTSHTEPAGAPAPRADGSSPSQPSFSAQDSESLRFTSPVGLVAALSNSCIDELMANPDFIVGPEDERLGEEHWRSLLMNFPKADLVIARGRTLIAERFERFVEFAGLDGPVRPIYEDTLEALARYLKTIYLLAAQRLGQKTAQALISRRLEEFRSRATLTHSDSFFFQDFAGKIYA